MSLFLGTHQNRLDAKGRVSIPAAFRTALRAGLEADAPTIVVLRPSPKHPCIECWPVARFEALKLRLDDLDPLSDEYEDLSATVYADSTPVEADKEGRIVLTTEMVARAQLTSQVAFMGMGGTFQIWDPEASAHRRTEARIASRQRELSRPAAGLA